MLEKLCNGIVNHRKLIGIFFAIILVLSVIGMSKVKINYDLSKYIPDDMPSKVALNLTKKEFGMQSTARIMINDIDLPTAKNYKEKLEAIDGVYKVMWLDDSIDVYQPESFIDQEELSKYYKDGSALYDIMFDEDDYSDSTYNAVGKIQELVPENTNMSGSAVDNRSMREHLQSEIVTIMLFLVPLTLIILLLTTDSYFSSLIFVTVIGVSILLNMGTNIIFDSVSFVTFSISAALQFAVSMDYSVFMLHQFEQDKKKYATEEEAMKKTVKHASLSIMSSSLTTIAGFVSLAFMSFGIGKDIGLVFAKGIVFSLLCVIILMPYLILTFSKQIEKTKHRSLLPSFDKFSRATLKLGTLLIVLSLIIIIPSYVAQKNNNFTYGSNSFGAGEGTKVYLDDKAIVDKFGRSNPIMLIVPNESYYKEKELVKELENLDLVDKVLTLVNQVPEGVPYDFIDEEIYSKFQNEKHTRIVVYVKTAAESELAFKTLDEVRDITSKYYEDRFYYTGTTPVTVDIEKSIQSDYNIVNLVSIFAILIILVFTFRSFVTPIILTMVIEAGIFINMAIPYYADESLIFVGYLIVSSIELGATIDYAILMTNNYLKFRKHYNKKMAAMNAIKESLASIITSGAILISAGYILKFISSMKAVSDMGELIGRGALISVILVVVVLPHFLSLFDKLVTKRVKTAEKRGEAGDGSEQDTKDTQMEIEEVVNKKSSNEDVKKSNNKKQKEKVLLKPREYVKNRHQQYREWRARSRDKILEKVISKAETLKKQNEAQLNMFDEKKDKDDTKKKVK